MRMREQNMTAQLTAELQRCDDELVPLPGIHQEPRRRVFVQQLVDSIRRVRYVPTMIARGIHASRADGLSPMFDPVKAAALQLQAGNFEEACWLVFLFVHFGKHPQSGYRYAREIYSALGTRPPWTFANASADIPGFRAWLDAHRDHISRGTGRGFGNHRKYESLSAYGPGGTGEAFATYVQWIQNHGSHAALIQMAIQQASGDAAAAFDYLYRSMGVVRRFGRTARFDYLAMLGKLGLAAIQPGSPCFSAATGPVDGARLMLQGNTDKLLSVRELTHRVQLIGQQLSVGMQELEDSLCNWQKSPDQYIRFLA